MVGLGGCVATVVDFDVDMNEVLILGPERVLQTTPGVHFGEVPRAAASFNRALERTRSRMRDCNRCVMCAGSLSLGLGGVILYENTNHWHCCRSLYSFNWLQQTGYPI